MKFATREGATARTLAVTAPGWIASAQNAPSRVAFPPRPARAPQRTTVGTAQTPSLGANRSNANKTTTVAYSRDQELFGPGRGAGRVYFVRSGCARHYSELQILAEQLLARDTSVRLATTLLSLARGFGRPTADGLTAITLPVTHQQLANMIGSNRVKVTRKLLEMQGQGAVKSLGRNSIAVAPDGLLAHAKSAAANAVA